MRCETWGGWIWVNLDPQAQPLDEFLNPIPNELNQFNSQDLRLIGSDHRVVNCNWKAVADAFLEVYHLRFIHKDGNLPELDNRGATMGLLPNGNSRMVTPFSESSAKAFEMEDWKDFKTFDNTNGPRVIPNLHPIMHSTRYAFTIFPNTVIPLGASGFLSFSSSQSMSAIHTYAFSITLSQMKKMGLKKSGKSEYLLLPKSLTKILRI